MAFCPLIEVERDIETEDDEVEGVEEADLTMPRPLRGAAREFVRPAGMKGDRLRKPPTFVEFIGMAETGTRL